MKTFSLAVAVVTSAASASAFCPLQQQSRVCTKTALQAHPKWWAPAAAAAMGWTLATQVAMASIPTNEQIPRSPHIASSTSLIAAMKKEPDDVPYEKLDFSLPSYGSNTKTGFGEGTQTFMGGSGGSLTDPGADESLKQAEAMRKAEAARKARIAEKNEATKAREAEAKVRGKQREAERKARMAGTFED